jgi:hypothetical protein
LNPPVRAVVPFPGWYVDSNPRTQRVWVLNPKALLGFIRNERYSLGPDDVVRLATAIEEHARSPVGS